MNNLRGEGSSDHNPLLLNLELTSASPTICAMHVMDESSVVISNLDTNKSKLFIAAECPRISIEICDTWTQIFDTGAPFSIYNPPAFRSNGGVYLAKALPTGNQINCSFTGATGGNIRAEQNYVMTFKVGERTLSGCFVVLTKHERNLPLFLFGQDLLMGPLEGVAVVPDEKHKLDKISVYFGIDWAARYPCEKGFVVRQPPKLPHDVSCLVQDLDIKDLEKYLPHVSRINPDKLFDEESLQENAFIFGGTPFEDEFEDDEEPYFAQDDLCYDIEECDQGFQDCS